MIKFFIPGEPDTVTAQEKGIRIRRSRTGKHYPQHYDKPEVEAAKRRLAWQVMDYKPFEPLTGPIELQIEWRFSLGSKPKKYAYKEKTTKPDLDNLCKGLMDVLNRSNFFIDDGQVCRLFLRKIWVPENEAGIYISIRDINEDPGGADND